MRADVLAEIYHSIIECYLFETLNSCCQGQSNGCQGVIVIEIPINSQILKIHTEHTAALTQGIVPLTRLQNSIPAKFSYISSSLAAMALKA